MDSGQLTFQSESCQKSFFVFQVNISEFQQNVIKFNSLLLISLIVMDRYLLEIEVLKCCQIFFFAVYGCNGFHVLEKQWDDRCSGLGGCWVNSVSSRALCRRKA